MEWEVEVTDQFIEWWEALSVDQQAALEVRVELLAESGPSLGRPAVDRIHTSRHHNMKELRAPKGGALRVLFAFDRAARWSCCWAATRAASGTPGTSGQSRPMTSTTSTSTR